MLLLDIFQLSLYLFPSKQRGTGKTGLNLQASIL
uniref:Uncharacterized protein n=1 Tax=Rhizophora mucronata TaxID=61149 RepID=A0A2P2N5E2_RHIMU